MWYACQSIAGIVNYFAQMPPDISADMIRVWIWMWMRLDRSCPRDLVSVVSKWNR